MAIDILTDEQVNALVLSEGQIGYNRAANVMKVGDGEKKWNELNDVRGHVMPPNDGKTYAVCNGEWVPFEGPEEKYDDTELRDRLADVEEALPGLRDEIAAKGARVVQLHTPEGSTYTIPPAGSETPLAHQFDLPSSYADWKIAGVGLFEIRDASDNRIYASIVQSFTMNSQGSVKVSFIGSSSSEKTAAKISIQATITPR